METPGLSIRLHVAPELVAAGVVAAVVYRRWGGASLEQEVAATAVTASELTLSVPAPEPFVHSNLPPVLGGPWPFAIGYLLVREAAGADGAEPQVLACAPSMRVLWTSAPFPAEAFAHMTADPRVSPEELAAATAGLQRLPVGLFLAHAGRPTRSLAGFEGAGDAVVALAPEGSLAWPPTVF